MIKHIAFIMDGNRRWATRRGLAKINGHKEGAETVKKVINFFLERKIPYVSLYTFSLENFKRSEIEKAFLFRLLVKESEGMLAECIEKEVRIKFIGDRSTFPKKVLPSCKKLEHETAGFSKLTVNFLFCYGGRQEIVDGVRQIAKKVQAGELAQDDITEDIFQQTLWSSESPEPDLIVRTGGQLRLSNFLLYQAAYSEFCFIDCMWPDLNEKHLDQIVFNYENRKRNFGV